MSGIRPMCPAPLAWTIAVMPEATIRIEGESPRRLEPSVLPDYMDVLYRAAWALCGSRHDAEDLVQETYLNVLKRPRQLRPGSELGYLLQALRNTHNNRYRSAVRRPRTSELFEAETPASPASEFTAHEIMDAIAGAP